MKYAIVIETVESYDSAYVPDLPGCVSTGYSIDEVKKISMTQLSFILKD